MRIVFTLITILFFSFNNANADELSEYKTDLKNVMIKGEILYAYNVTKGGVKLNNSERFIVRYNGYIFRCFIDKLEYFCIAMIFKK